MTQINTASAYWQTKEFKLDVKDKRILQSITEDCRAPLSQVAKEVALSRDAVDYRIKRLEEDKVITLYYPRINYKLFGYSLYYLFFLIDEDDQQKKAQFIENIKQHPNVIYLFEYSDRWDMQIALLAKDIQQFDQILQELTNEFSDIIIEKDVLEVVRQHTHRILPKSLCNNEPHLKDYSLEPISIDAKDRAILKELCKDARQSTYDIGEKVKLSSDAVLYRMKKLKENKVITEYTATCNLEALGYGWFTCGISFKKFIKQDETKFAEFVRNNDHIIRASKCIGPWDVMMNISVKEIEEFHTTLKSLKKNFKDIIKSYDVWIGYQMHHFNPFPKVLEEMTEKK